MGVNCNDVVNGEHSIIRIRTTRSAKYTIKNSTKRIRSDSRDFEENARVGERSAWGNVKPKSAQIIQGKRKFITQYSRISNEHTSISIFRFRIEHELNI